jgi:hypothetical protein
MKLNLAGAIVASRAMEVQVDIHRRVSTEIVEKMSRTYSIFASTQRLIRFVENIQSISYEAFTKSCSKGENEKPVRNCWYFGRSNSRLKRSLLTRLC